MLSSKSLLFLCAACAFGADEKPASVAGMVTNALTGEPLARAQVSLNGMGRRLPGVTSEAGKFSITDVPAGAYMVFVRRVGFTQTADRTAKNWVEIVLRAGDSKDDLKLKLTPAGAITGRVIDADGEPMEAVMVSVDSGLGNFTATTDDKGQYRIGSLAPGKYRVKASPVNLPIPAEIRTDGTQESFYMATYHPSSANEKGAARVLVQPGAETGGIEIQLLRAPLVRVSGAVADMPKGSRVTINCSKASGGRAPGGGVNEDGTFEVWRLDPGKYTITADAFSNGKRTSSAPVEVEVAGGNIEHLQLRMIPPFEVSGQVEFKEEQPANQPAQRQLVLRGVRGSTASQLTPVKIDADGSFRLEDVQPGRYGVSLSWGPAFVESTRLGQIESEGDIVDLSNGAGGAKLIVRVSTAVAEVSGVVRDEKGPVGGVTVALALENAEPNTMPKLVTSGEDGSYKIAGVAPGKYKLTAIDPSDLATLQGSDTDYEDVMQIVEIRAGDKLVKDLKSK